MINNKEYLEDNVNEVSQILNNSNLHNYLNMVFNEGILQHKKRTNLGERYEIETYPASKGFSKIREIGNIICNKKEFWPDGVSADVILAQKIPVIKIRNIILTIKSTKNVDTLWKKPKDYMKQYSKLNNGLTPQIEIVNYDLEENLNELKVNLGAKYYGILAYKLGSDSNLENMQIIFLSDNADTIVHTVDIPIISTEDKIIPEDKSLKDEIGENKGESLRSKIELR